MYSKFNLTLDDYYAEELNRHSTSGNRIYQEHEAQAKRNLKEFIYDNGHVNGSAMKSNWFQIKNVDIFISHSHQDINKVKAFAGWLYDVFKLTAFIDSCVWGYCDELLRQIDNEYCKLSDGSAYNYDLRNYTTSHVHMMLSTALTEMIDNTECIIFYNTPNAVSLKNDLETIKEETSKVTPSPWIYHELAMTSLVRRSEVKRKSVLLEKSFDARKFDKLKPIEIEHDVDKYLKEMIDINYETLDLWHKKYSCTTPKSGLTMYLETGGNQPMHPLDVLYQICKPNGK